MALGSLVCATRKLGQASVSNETLCLAVSLIDRRFALPGAPLLPDSTALRLPPDVLELVFTSLFVASKHVEKAQPRVVARVFLEILCGELGGDGSPAWPEIERLFAPVPRRVQSLAEAEARLLQALGLNLEQLPNTACFADGFEAAIALPPHTPEAHRLRAILNYLVVLSLVASQSRTTPPSLVADAATGIALRATLCTVDAPQAVRRASASLAAASGYDDADTADARGWLARAARSAAAAASTCVGARPGQAAHARELGRRRTSLHGPSFADELRARFDSPRQFWAMMEHVLLTRAGQR